MKHIGEAMPDFEGLKPVPVAQMDYSEEKCLVCGSNVRFIDNQHKKACRKCGTVVFEKNYQHQRRKREISCWCCCDTGIVRYPVQQDGRLYDYYARCSCPNGMNWPSTIPLLEKCENAPKSEYIELRNRKIFGKVWGGDSK